MNAYFSLNLAILDTYKCKLDTYGGSYRQSWQISRYIENILSACILASVFVSVQKWSFRPLLSLRYLNSSGMNLNWAIINLRECPKLEASKDYLN